MGATTQRNEADLFPTDVFTSAASDITHSPSVRPSQQHLNH